MPSRWRGFHTTEMADRTLHHMSWPFQETGFWTQVFDWCLQLDFKLHSGAVGLHLREFQPACEYRGIGQFGCIK